jgi:hypothetical protein
LRYCHAFTEDEDKILAAALAYISYFRYDQKKGVSFPLTVLSPHPKKGAAASPLNCRVKIPANQFNEEKSRFNQFLM